jgi:hypothetical protein
MKAKHYFLAAAVGMFTLAAGSAMAFHGGGVAHCDGCHSMHASADNPVEGFENTTLLKGSDPSSTCLNCHDGAGGYHINSDDGSNINQGGDFYWVSNPYTTVVRGSTVTWGGDNAGHNVVAFDFGMVADPRPENSAAPGGTFSATNLGCTSCHDPHGQKLGGTAGGQLPISVSGSYGGVPDAGTMAGNYRLLGDSQYKYGNFTYDAPIARANGSSGTTTRYASGMSEWCANCHGDYLSSPTKHPVSQPLNGQGANYNSYVATGDFTGTQATSWDPLVPFEDLTATTGADLDLASTAGPATGAAAQVMCLTCHRAHASAFNNAGRWDLEVDFIAEAAALTSADVPATAVPYYGDNAAIDVATKYGHTQRSLCNKCHVQD